MVEMEPWSVLDPAPHIHRADRWMWSRAHHTPELHLHHHHLILRLLTSFPGKELINHGRAWCCLTNNWLHWAQGWCSLLCHGHLLRSLQSQPRDRDWTGQSQLLAGRLAGVASLWPEASAAQAGSCSELLRTGAQSGCDSNTLHGGHRAMLTPRHGTPPSPDGASGHCQAAGALHPSRALCLPLR